MSNKAEGIFSIIGGIGYGIYTLYNRTTSSDYAMSALMSGERGASVFASANSYGATQDKFFYINIAISVASIVMGSYYLFYKKDYYCPHCKSKILKDVTKCPHCTSDIINNNNNNHNLNIKTIDNLQKNILQDTSYDENEEKRKEEYAKQIQLKLVQKSEEQLITNEIAQQVNVRLSKIDLDKINQIKIKKTPLIREKRKKTLIALILISITVACISTFSKWYSDNKTTQENAKDELIQNGKTSNDQLSVAVNSLKVDSKKFEMDIEGLLKIEGEWGVIAYMNNETGDFLPCFFKVSSTIGKKILTVCSEGSNCKIVGDMEDIVAPNVEKDFGITERSGTLEIIDIKSVSK